MTSTVEVFGAPVATPEKRDVEVFTDSPKWPGNAQVKRQATGPVTQSPTSIPAYASPCSGIAGYSSACRCLGVTSSTITVATPIFRTTVMTVITVVQTLPATTYTTLETTTTSTSGAVTTASFCPPNNVRPGSTCGCNYDLKCSYRLTQNIAPVVVTLTGVTLTACIADCDNRAQCASLNYQISTGQCTQYTYYSPSTTRFTQGVDDADFVAVNLVYDQPSCASCSS